MTTFQSNSLSLTGSCAESTLSESVTDQATTQEVDSAQDVLTLHYVVQQICVDSVDYNIERKYSRNKNIKRKRAQKSLLQQHYRRKLMYNQVDDRYPPMILLGDSSRVHQRRKSRLSFVTKCWSKRRTAVVLFSFSFSISPSPRLSISQSLNLSTITVPGTDDDRDDGTNYTILYHPKNETTEPHKYMHAHTCNTRSVPSTVPIHKKLDTTIIIKN